MYTTLPTWRARSAFAYQGSVSDGTEIAFGREGRLFVSAICYVHLLTHFGAHTVPVGTGHGLPPAGSLGRWLWRNVARQAIASYVAPILIHEGYAERAGRPSEIRFLGRLPSGPRHPLLPGFGDPHLPLA